jgi:hypothetical protein
MVGMLRRELSLSPRTKETSGAPANRESIGTSIKVPGIDLAGAQILKVGEGGEFRGDFWWRKEQLKRLARLLNPR